MPCGRWRRAVELAPAEGDPLAAIREATESPALRVRSVSVHLFNEQLEKDWYFDQRFWNRYCEELARNRYNNLILTFSDQTNYLCPIYAYLLEVPGYPQVRVRGLTAADRQRNLAMLQKISETAHAYGLDFTLAIWMQMPVPKYVAEVRVEGLPAGVAAGGYCAAGLAQVLAQCPAIDGVQFRMNAEAGVSEAEQLEFYRPLFRAIADCGRPLKVDLRYKGVRPETIEAAAEMGLDLTLSTKFWCEHMGLPYHPTVSDTHYRASRYSFGNMLAEPRKYRVSYQLWTVGSQRLLLWGDPDYAARFARKLQAGGRRRVRGLCPAHQQGLWQSNRRLADSHQCRVPPLHLGVRAVLDVLPGLRPARLQPENRCRSLAARIAGIASAPPPRRLKPATSRPARSSR